MVGKSGTATTTTEEISITTSNSHHQTISLVDPTKTTVEANYLIQVTLDQNSLNFTSDEIGYVVTSSLEEFSKLSWSVIQERKQILFNSLENNDVINTTNQTFTQKILLGNNQQVTFYQIQDSNLSSISATDNQLLEEITDSRLNIFSINSTTEDNAILSTSSGLSITLDELTADQNLNDFIGRNQSISPVLDLTSIPDIIGSTLSATVNLAREASSDSVVGFYRVVDNLGSIKDPLTGSIISPGDENYAEKALDSFNLVSELSDLSVEDNNTKTSQISIDETSMIAPYAIVNNVDTYFAFGAANSDNYDHFKSLGLNTFGLEDKFGGGDNDNDDLIIQFDFMS